MPNHVSSIVMLFAIFCNPLMAQEMKSNPDLFNQCTDYFNERAVYNDRIVDNISRAKYTKAKLADLDAEIDIHVTEIKRLDKILKIIRNDYSLVDKRNRVVKRYSNAIRAYNEFLIVRKREHADHQSNVDHSNGINHRINAQCYGTWSGKILGRFCGHDKKRYQLFCAKFN